MNVIPIEQHAAFNRACQPHQIQTSGTGEALKKAVALGILLAEIFELPQDMFFAADENHEELSPGAASLAMEGGPHDWTIGLCDKYPQVAALCADLEIWLEPILGCIVAIYPDESGH